MSRNPETWAREGLDGSGGEEARGRNQVAMRSEKD